MAFDDLKAELALLINQMENQPEDPHELYLQIRERLNEMRAYGMPLPEDLVEFEKEMEAQFAATEKVVDTAGNTLGIDQIRDARLLFGIALDAHTLLRRAP